MSKKNNSTRENRGPQGFDAHYAHVFGERWPLLRATLSGEPSYRTLAFPGAEPYHLDEASVLAAEALAVKPGMDVLDLCAAPGGKSLVLASQLAGSGNLVCNELSPDRRERLRRVLDASLPAEWRSIVNVSAQNGSLWGVKRPVSQDRVLVDAPCSSERHVLASPPHLAEWSPARSRNLAHRQLALACAGFDALRPGGFMVYSTCALDPRENSEVMEALSRKRRGMLAFDTPPQSMGSADGPGWSLWPDQCNGRGPIWFCRIHRLP